MLVCKGATYCETCPGKPEVVKVGDTWLHVGKNRELKYIPGHQIFVGSR